MARCRRPGWPRRSRSTASTRPSPRPGPCEPAGHRAAYDVRSNGRPADKNEEQEIYLAAIEVKVPDIGDFKDVPVIEVLVKPGDIVKKDDSLITLESDKATMEVPAPSAGTVKDVRVKVGDKVSEGVAII